MYTCHKKAGTCLSKKYATWLGKIQDGCFRPFLILRTHKDKIIFSWIFTHCGSTRNTNTPVSETHKPPPPTARCQPKEE